MSEKIETSETPEKLAVVIDAFKRLEDVADKAVLQVVASFSLKK